MTGNAKTVAQSRCIMTEIVLPNDTNGLGTMMGGRLMHLMDKCAAISAQRHANCVCVTASVDFMRFQAPIHQGEIVILESWVNRAFRTSMEVELIIFAENPKTHARRKCNHAIFTFVALDESMRPTPIPPLQPETLTERARFERAAKRREVRLYFSGRLALDDATIAKEDLLSVLAATEQEPPAQEDS